MISLVEISSNKHIERPVIGAFLNCSGTVVVWTTGPKVSRLLRKFNNQTTFGDEYKEKKIRGGPAQRRNAP